MSHTFYRTAQGEERRIPCSGDALEMRTPHTSFRRRSRPLGQAYAPSEVSGILFLNNIQNKRQDDILFYTNGMINSTLFLKIQKLCDTFN